MIWRSVWSVLPRGKPEKRDSCRDCKDQGFYELGPEQAGQFDAIEIIDLEFAEILAGRSGMELAEIRENRALEWDFEGLIDTGLKWQGEHQSPKG